MRTKKANYIIIMVIVFCISIGYAYLSSSLNINGLGHLKKSTWNVYFDNVEILSGEDLASVKPVVDKHKTTDIEYTVNFDVPGDVFSFNVDVVNNGTIDAMISLISDTVLTDEQKKYAEYSITYLDGTPILEKNFLGSYSSDTFLITVSYKENLNPEDLPVDAKSINFNLSLEYVQAKDSDKKINKSNIIKDLSGNNNNAILYGAKVNDDGTVTTDGVDDFINCGLSGYDFKNSISLVIKMKFEKFGGGNEFFGNWDNGGSGIYRHGSKFAFDIYDVTISDYKEFTSNYSPQLNTWYTLVGTYDGTALKFYINGEAIPDENGDLEYPVNGNIRPLNIPFVIGGNPIPGNSISNASNITVASALIFDRALSEEEVARDYNVEINPTNTTNMLFYYRFEK